MKIGKSLFVIFLFGCQTQIQPPVLSYYINDDGMKDFYSITYQNFEDQFGNDFTTEIIDNNIYVANFFFTRCPSICPPMRTSMIKLANDLEGHEGFKMVSHTIDPNYDTIEVLKNYSENTGISPTRWIFVRSSEANTKAQANQFMTNFRPNDEGTDFYHSSYLALVDHKGQIRGFYNALIEAEIIRLKQDIDKLL